MQFIGYRIMLYFHFFDLLCLSSERLLNFFSPPDLMLI
uniref:Uncharacterized protein n=1 Tax=Arundo donax TaxID=35708 RepID=A0A0A9CIN1_ARUDO